MLPRLYQSLFQVFGGVRVEAYIVDREAGDGSEKLQVDVELDWRSFGVVGGVGADIVEE